MKFNKDIHHRKSIRLKGYDYTSPGAYFITICTQNRECLFGDIVGEEMRLNELGIIVESEWKKTGIIRKNIFIDAFVIMPNHLHGILVVEESTNMVGRGTVHRAPTQEGFSKPTSNSIPTIIRSFKATTTKQINIIRNLPLLKVWQSNYYEHIVRNELELDKIRNYILTNPLRWSIDKENPVNLKK